MKGTAAASASFHAGLVMGALSTHGCDFESAQLEQGTRVVLLGKTRAGLPLELTVEIHDDGTAAT